MEPIATTDSTQTTTTKIILDTIMNSRGFNVNDDIGNNILVTTPPVLDINLTEGNVNSNIVLNCEILNFNYNIVTLTISTVLILISVLFCLFGYRCFKATLFLTGFVFSFLIVYVICQEEDLLTEYGNIGVSLTSGVLYGLICLLVPYVGFFTLGFLNGILTGFVTILIFKITYSIWIIAALLLGTGLIAAIANICYPSLTILTTALLGSAGIIISSDYILENFKMLHSVFNHVKNRGDVELCFLNWAMLIAWLIVFVLSCFIQQYLTASGFVIRNYPYQEHPTKRQNLTREDRIIIKQTKYRYLYQIRTSGGDILSQSYIKSLQNKSQLNTLSTHMSTL